jgi:transcriptional regulator with XRE-family HTH domain
MDKDNSQPEPSADRHRIKTLRLERGLRAADVAKKAGLSLAQIYRLEAGERPNVAAVTLARIALVLNSSVEYLLTLTDDQRSVCQLIDELEQASGEHDGRE